MASSVDIDVNDFYNEVMAAFEANYEHNFSELVDDVYGAADDARDELRKATGIWSQEDDTPERQRLAYERGWKSYKHAPDDGHVEAVVANASAPGLTHLIEKGHELFVYGRDTGRRTQARPHISDAFEHASARHFRGGDAQ